MKFAFIGMGNMGRAMCTGLIKSGAVKPEEIKGYAPHYEKLKAYCETVGICACKSANEAVKDCDVIIMAVKPYQIENVISDLGGAIDSKAIVSVVAGWTCEKLQALVGGRARVQYVMPNTPVSVLSGVMMFEKDNTLNECERNEIIDRFSKMGLVTELDEHLMGAGMAIAGCGPAFCAMIIEALGDAGVKYGLQRKDAYKLAAQTLAGTGMMQLTTGIHPGELKDGVCSPAGTTIKGVEALEKAGIRAAMFDAVNAVLSK